LPDNKGNFLIRVTTSVPLVAKSRRHGRFQVKFRWDDFATFIRQKSITEPLDDAAGIYWLALAVWQEHWPPGQRMHLISVGASSLAAVEQRQLGLPFDSDG
jgi:hypothetical protein